MLLGKPLAQWTEQDVYALLENQVPEGRQLDYKRELRLDNDEAKRDFLADVCALANTAGGYLIFGVEEDDGIPKAVPGLEDFNRDEDIRRIESLILSGIDPRLVPEPEPREIPLPNGRSILVLHIPRSWVGPHAVTFKGKGSLRVYGRGDKQNYPMDMQQLRQAILQSAVLEQQIRDFRQKRLALIQTRTETPVPVVDGFLIVVHCVPASAFASGVSLDVIAAERNTYLRQVLRVSTGRFNLDGFVRHPSLRNGRAPAYLQFFRSGIMEYVRDQPVWGSGEPPKFAVAQIEDTVMNSTRNCLFALEELGAVAPVWVMVSLVGYKGAWLFSSRVPFLDERDGFIDRDPLVLPEIMVDRFDADLDQTLRPLFDMLWQSAGYPQCLHYNKDGRWTPPGS